MSDDFEIFHVIRFRPALRKAIAETKILDRMYALPAKTAHRSPRHLDASGSSPP